MTELLGEGCYGQVSKAIYNGTEVAVKNIEEKESFSNELKIFKHIKDIQCKNIVKMKGYDTDKKIIYMDLIKNSLSLEDMMSEYNMDIGIKEYYLEQIIDGVMDLIKSSILHRDFKLKNILVNTETDDLYIHDFGLSKIKKTNLLEYRYELYIIILQLFLEEDTVIKLVETGFNEKWLNDVEGTWDIPEFNKQLAYDYPNSFEIIYHIFDKLGSKYFIEKNLLNNELSKKYFNLLLCL